MVIDKKDVERALLSKGFKRSDKDHHYFIYWTRDNKKTSSKTKTSHTQKEKTLGSGRIGQMAKQCGINTDEFIDLVQCPMTRERYEQVLQSKGLI